MSSRSRILARCVLSAALAGVAAFARAEDFNADPHLPPAEEADPAGIAAPAPAATAPEDVSPPAAVVVREAASVENGAPGTEPDGGAPAVAEPAADGTTDAPAPSDVLIRTLGEEGLRVHFVERDGTWSMHAENVPTNEIFRLWQEVGGPQVISRLPIDRTYTISVHRERPERILERLLENYGYTLHYGADGRLEMVRVYSPEPSNIFKTPRLVENLPRWREIELTPPASASSSPE